MTKISRWPVEKEKMGLFLDDFWTAVASLKSKTEARNFFNQFLTHTERKMFAKRFQIAVMLLLGYDYKTIIKRVKVSNSTIANVNNWLEENRLELKDVVQRIIRLKEEKLQRIEGGKRRARETLGTAIIKAGIGEMVGKIKEIKKESSLTK